MRYILQERARAAQEVWDAERRLSVGRGGRNILAVVGAAKGASGKRQAKKNKKKVSGSVLTAGAAVSLLLPLLFASSLATAAGADLELLLLLLGRTPEDEMRSAGCQASVDRCAGTGA